jgi:hypothetical protein
MPPERLEGVLTKPERPGGSRPGRDVRVAPFEWVRGRSIAVDQVEENLGVAREADGAEATEVKAAEFSPRRGQ